MEQIKVSHRLLAKPLPGPTLIINWAARDKLQWNRNLNTRLYIRENAYEYVVCEMANILSRLLCVNQVPDDFDLYHSVIENIV